MKKLTLVVVLLCFYYLPFGQSPIGQFSSHIPLHSFYSVAVADDYIYAATNNGLMLLDKSTLAEDVPAVSSWSKVDGLSDIDISKIAFDKESNTLIISYDNGNLDFVKENKLYNIRDVKDKSISGSKKVSGIHTYGNKGYLVYPFGVVVIDLNSLLILDTWFTKLGNTQYISYDIAQTDERYYVSTDRGIFSISRQSGNPANFQEWQFESTGGEKAYDQLCYFGGMLLANYNASDGQDSDDTLYILNNGEWMPTTIHFFDLRSMHENGSELALTGWDQVQVYDTNLNKIYTAFWYDENSRYPDIWEAQIDEDNIWSADKVYGLVQANRTYHYKRFATANGPYSSNTENICCQNGIVAIVPGGYSGSNLAPSFQQATLSWFLHDQWSYNSTDFAQFDHFCPTYDMVNVAINPNNENEWYLASWGGGLFKCVNQRPTEHFVAANSLLDSTSNGNTYVSGLGFDSKGNLWMTNSQCSNMLKMLEPNGTWHAYNISSGVITSSNIGVVAKHLLVDSRNYKWITFPRDDSFNRYHLVAFYEGSSYDNPGEYQFARVDMNAAAEVNSATVNCIAEDLDGEIWIGTDKGVKVIYYPSNIFKGNALPRNVLLEQDGYVSVLFEFEEITAIAVDGANRKWIGTSKAGAFLMSDDGQKQLLHFTAEDHPMFSNQINAINIDQQTGEVFFGTAKGLISYRGDAVRGYETYEKEMVVYPNPVKHDYSGPVAVRGMKENSLCKITDANGKLIWQGYSSGGQLIWDCKDYFGQRPATGVYYVMASDKEGKEKVVAKFLFIN